MLGIESRPSLLTLQQCQKNENEEKTIKPSPKPQISVTIHSTELQKERVFAEAQINISKFEATRYKQLLIEGPEFDWQNDFSYPLVD